MRQTVEVLTDAASVLMPGVYPNNDYNAETYAMLKDGSVGSKGPKRSCRGYPSSFLLLATKCIASSSMSITTSSKQLLVVSCY